MDYQMQIYLLESLYLNKKFALELFKFPKESRFKSLFENIKPKRKRKTLSVNPKNIMLGLDKRTSIIIKNIPETMTSDQLNKIILNYTPNYDFFYIPLKIRTRKKLRVAFVNVTNSLEIVPVYMGLLYKIKFIYDNPSIKMEICYSKIQGKDQLIQRFFQELNFSQV